MALNCQSYNCIHNDKEGKCFARNIKIGGKNAKTTSSTTCNSYFPAENSQSYEIANEFIETDKFSSDRRNIKCEAKNCRFNMNKACIASNVKINDKDASCETFQT